MKKNKETINYSYRNELGTKENIHNNLSLCIGDLGFFLTNEIILKKLIINQTTKRYILHLLFSHATP